MDKRRAPKKTWQFSLTIALVALGLLLSFQFKLQKARQHDLSLQSTESLLALSKSLSDRSYELNREIWDLKSQKKLLETSSKENNLDQTLRRELEKAYITNGTSPVKGTGITITISEPAANPFFHNDLLEIINEAWNAGAEAISVNDQRITVFSTVSSHQEAPFIAVNDALIKYPIVIKAIGQPETLQSGINIAGGIIVKLSVELKIPIEIKTSPKLSLPAAKEIPPFHFAKKAG